ncbi:MAG: hypothetical protein K2X34_11440 [Hyphomonadaceae bacterium]|nr:hypothetical protein [Hyphomonadaceae bacterium]
MKNKLFAAALAALTLATAGAASAQDYRRGDRDRDWDRGRAEITIRRDGRTFDFDRGDRMFYRLLDRPFHFRPGMTYSYTDRCNRRGCVVFVFDGRYRRPVDRIFAPHLPMRGWAWRHDRGFDGEYARYGSYDRDDRGWRNEDDRLYREQRDGRGDRDWDRDDDDRGERDRGDRGRGDGRRDGSGLEGGPSRPR